MLKTEEYSYHVPVLIEETLELLNVKTGGIYVDCTFGGGGHSKAILEKLTSEGRVVAFDQDEAARQNLPNDDKLLFIPHNFRHIKRFLQLHGIREVDGILADLGVSSHQFDERDRGFSTRFDAKLDMRMDQRQSLTAVNILNDYSETELHKIFELYGEVTNSKTLARTIVEVRKITSLLTTNGFKEAVSSVVKGNPHKYFAQVFQALRIEVNDEFGALKEMLEQVPQLLKKGGRIAVITFHSLEDRIVKMFFREGTFKVKEENPFVMDKISNPLEAINKKPIQATEEEVGRNSRARSARLRVAEKV